MNGQLTKGFAFAAYPAEYRNSGVVTFIVNQDGVVYEKDLGEDTATIAAAMSEFNPDRTWKTSGMIGNAACTHQRKPLECLLMLGLYCLATCFRFRLETSEI